MEAIIKRLAWDSEFFGIEVGEIEPGLADSISISGFELIYCKCPNDDKPELVGYANTFSEIKILFSKPLIQSNYMEDKHVIPAANMSFDIADLYELAYISGNFSRFKLDGRFAAGYFEKMYRAWVDNSLNGQYADQVFLYVMEGKVAGFVSYKINNHDFATIGLISVSPEFQGQGIGKTLITAVESELVEKHVGSLRIPTQQSNQQACSVYSKLGYQIIESNRIRHYWKT